jgi:hypothetical protein
VGAPRKLVEAAGSYRRASEDRLTELFATTLANHPGFCARVTAAIGMGNGDRYEITTQHWADPETRVDMRLQSVGRNSETLSVAYVENKIEGYWFADTQIPRERAGLDTEPAEHRRFACVVTTEQYGQLETANGISSATATLRDFDTALTWTDISRLAEALKPEAPAAQRVLMEFIHYLTEDAMPSPLSREDLASFAVAWRINDTVMELLEDAAFDAKPHVPLSGRRANEIFSEDESTTGVPLVCFDFAIPDGHWLDVLGGSLAAALSPSDPGSSAGDGEPTLYAGIYVGKKQAKAVRADQTWMRAASNAAFGQIPYDGFWVCRSAQLALIEEAETFDDQVRRLGAWLREALDVALALPQPNDPGEPIFAAR